MLDEFFIIIRLFSLFLLLFLVRMIKYYCYNYNLLFKFIFNKLNIIFVFFWCLDIGKFFMNFMIIKKIICNIYCYEGKEVNFVCYVSGLYNLIFVV